MATRKIAWQQWIKGLATHVLDEDGSAFDSLNGYPIADVHDKLGVHRSRVYQMIQEGKLDTVQIVNKSGNVVLTLVTQLSMDRYLSERRPLPGRQGYFSFSPDC